MNTCVISSPVGFLRIGEEEHAIVLLDRMEKQPEAAPVTPLLQEAVRQLQEYFAGMRQVFDLPVRLHGTPFRQKVWAQLQTIPYGETRSYGELAAMVGQPKAARAIGGANHHNPVSIIVPCHRVIGADGSLTGYGGGIAMKEWLLRHEQLHAGSQ